MTVQNLSGKNNINKKRTGAEAGLGTSETALPLVPAAVLAPLWFISLALPNLVYSGIYWHDTLHLIKWVAAGVPVGIAILVAGFRLVQYKDRVDFRIDPFGALWLGLLAYSMTQAAWVNVSSPSGFVHELLCFAAVWAFYVISWNSFPGRTVRPLLWLANLNAAVNVVFAELQMRGLSGFTSLILPTPGNYIGNTGQQNMFGLWMAVCVMGSVYLYIAYAVTPSGRKRHPAVTVLNLLLMGVNMWGLLNSTSRSAILSLAVALAVMSVIVLRQFGRDYAKRLMHVGLVFLLIVGLSAAYNPARAVAMSSKFLDMLQHAETIGGRDGIWTTSYTMFKMRPLSGVGIGQFKWHYLEAQREVFKTHPDVKWQYTHWAHNEFLQWFCEGGAAGGVLLLSMWGLWLFLLAAALWRGKDKAMAPEVIWACSMIALVTFNALWTRPFHRIENILWLSLAFAVSNKSMTELLMPKLIGSLKNLSRGCGIVLLATGLSGLYYLSDGMIGDRTIREAMSTTDPIARLSLLEEASRHVMVRSDALKLQGYYYLQLGEQAQDIQALERGFNLLWRHFLSEPHSEDLRVLLDWAQRFQSIDVLKTLSSYLKPGTYRLGVQHDATDSDGNVVSAVVLVPLRESGGMKLTAPVASESEFAPYDEAAE